MSRRASRNRTCLLVLALMVACSTLAALQASAEVLPYGLKIEKVLDNSAELGDLAQSPANELWFLERAGTIRVFDAGQQVATLDLTSSVTTSCESGLLDVAFAPDHAKSGLAFLYYVDDTGRARVDELYRESDGLALGTTLLDLGTTLGGCRPGGGLEVGPDGKLYVAVGDLESSGDAQSDGSLAGKVLRANLDGSVPLDNASATLVWAKGFRDGKDLVINPGTARPNGTVYVSDRGQGTTDYDEINAVSEGANYGWDATTGPDPGYVDPLDYQYSIVPEGLEALTGPTMGPGMEGTILYACQQADEVTQAYLTGPDLDQLDRVATFFDPLGDRDGTPDAGCPREFNALAEGRDGWLYGANVGANPGIWRMYRDEPGPREVSAPGSPFQLTVDKDGSDLTLGWENLGTLDAGRPADGRTPSRHAGQHATTYQIWEGSLPIGGSYDHGVIVDTDGTPQGPSRLTDTVIPSTGNRYYLVGAQGDNLEGSLGAARPGESDHCDSIGWGIAEGQCAEGWLNPADGTTLYLTDYNPNSPTYMQQLTMSDFRGTAVRMDISATNCFWCDVQADYLHNVDLELRDRDVRIVTLMMNTYNYWDALSPSNCASEIATWASNNGETSPILCDTDHDGDGHADASWQYYNGCGTPSNYYIDQGHVIYSFVCGAELSSTDMANTLRPEANPESCE